METSRVKSVVRNQAEAKLNQLEQDEPAETMNQLQALKRKDEPAVARSSRKLQWIQSQRKDFQSQCLCIQTQEDKSIIDEEDSGEAIDEPDASTASSRKDPDARKADVAKQLTTYEELSKLDVNC
ncbi:hypothetical protein F511_24965 [Dorcoceras hygrometricum]|uniref:Uncharacterized protein n=1 Tax=Dorcoceras hygrometricum TaxID=472368 RepID=A0A2Z7DJ79_9LAMI|nr:hypothetical protein F511_24965 [Dorcoceras hygrometricum]